MPSDYDIDFTELDASGVAQAEEAAKEQAISAKRATLRGAEFDYVLISNAVEPEAQKQARLASLKERIETLKGELADLEG